MNLEELGWDAFFADAFEPHGKNNLIPARVSARHHGPCELFTELGPMGGLPSGKLSDEELPAVGDWVAVRPVAGREEGRDRGGAPASHRVHAQGGLKRTVAQVIAANVDTVFVVTAFGFDLNPRRLERYLTSAWDSGASPVIVVNKTRPRGRPRGRAPGGRAGRHRRAGPLGQRRHGSGLEALEPYLGLGLTIALLGSSGVGKSTLVNHFAGRELLATAATSAGGRGRHTTSHRELVPLPSGAVLLDTPGMRELQLWADEEVLDTTFGEISELAAKCRFSDCAHEQEPGCAVREALSNGALAEERFTSYRKLQREMRALEIRKDNRLRSEARKERARFARSQRKSRW